MSPTCTTLILMNMLLIVATEDTSNTESAQVNRQSLRQSESWIRKMRMLFRQHDFDGDGVICQKDFDFEAKRFADLEDFDPVQRKVLQQKSRDRFLLYTKAAGTEDDVLMTEDLLIESVNMQRDDPEFKERLRDIVNGFLIPMKVDQEGYLSYREYQRLFESLGFVDTSFTQEGFAVVDADHDGRVSFEEYLDAVYNYLWSDGAKTSAMFEPAV